MDAATHTPTVRPAADADYPMLAVLVNATHEPHFHVTSADLAARDARPASGLRGRLVAEIAGAAIGMASYAVQDFDRADRVWLDLAIHPDHRRSDVALRLVDAVLDRARAAGATSLWMPVREDYLDAWPNIHSLGFAEVHRTFGGGFFLTDTRDLTRHISQAVQLRSIDQASDELTAQARQLYAALRTDKVTTPPTITAAYADLDLDDDVVAPASFLALRDDACIGICLAAPSSLGAWLSVVAVHPDHRRRGIARSMLVATLTALRNCDIGFLNTAGVRSDAAYLGLLRSLGAAIEPDWISYQRAN